MHNKLTMNLKSIRRAALSVSLVFVSAVALAQTDTTKRNAQSAAAAAARLLTQTEETKVAAPKPDYWTNSLMTNLNFVQSSFTNWAKGGYNNYALSAYIDGNAKWKKGEMYWNNRLQLDYGFLYSADKPIIQKNKDRILFESTWGYKATKTLNYSAKFTFLSQFANGYNYPTPSVEGDEEPSGRDWRNARVLKSSLLSPGTVNLGLGIDWVPSKWLTVNMAPLTGGFTIVMSERLRKNYGMDRRRDYEDLELNPDKKDDDNIYYTTGYYYKPARFEFGAQVTADAKLKVNANFECSTHLLLFSNYLKNPENLRVNWDTRMMWKFSKFFSLNITTNLIYDDTVLITDKEHENCNGHRRVQFAQALQFGFTYTFASKK